MKDALTTLESISSRQSFIEGVQCGTASVTRYMKDALAALESTCRAIVGAPVTMPDLTFTSDTIEAFDNNARREWMSTGTTTGARPGTGGPVKGWLKYSGARISRGDCLVTVTLFDLGNVRAFVKVNHYER